MQRKWLLILLVGVFLTTSLPTSVMATQPITVMLNDEQLQFDASPVMENDRVLVPLRTVFEALGAVVDYDATTETITATKGQTRIRLQTFATHGFLNEEAVNLDAPAKVFQGRTMVPLRFVSEALGAGVRWDAWNRTVRINQASQPELKTGVLDDVNSIAWEYIRNDIAQLESSGSVKIIDSKMIRLELVKEFAQLTDTPIYVYALEYRLLPDDLSKVVLAGGMQVDEAGWLMETCSMGSPQLVISRKDGVTSLIGILWTGTVIEEGGDLETSLKALLERNN
ncbi:hypothetical protein SPSYN_01424 [Sporotomaculum syntrophicum]|uniref:Copper amine oxidase-like N-terminal domain-containing protein n=1 Tax=Sporotomaculum syntrophicum TaxID=182264 RepID=A0A9D3AYZ4_9FIRM|nr:copper amine oxidase N-terminal domain-containing protein [Sporotomaculum syntrophicum]KAF1085288.1 hypothetical protein SPSYN_01424 [Sporotomaculum syntrophicum]